MGDYGKSLITGVITGLISSIVYDFVFKPFLIGNFSLLGIRQLDTVLVGISFFVIGLIFARSRWGIRIIFDKSDQHRIAGLSRQIEELTYRREMMLQEGRHPEELRRVTNTIEQLEEERENVLKRRRRREY